LLRLRVRPLGGHVILCLPGFLPRETFIPQTALPSLSLLPLLPEVDVDNGGQNGSISHRPLHTVACVSRLCLMARARVASNSRSTTALIPISKGDMAL
jgi:hypothetical protein